MIYTFLVLELMPITQVPLAAKFNGGAVNGWEYIEVKKDNQWIRLEELRHIWRSSYDQERFTVPNFH